MVRAPPMREAIDVFGEWAEVGKDEGMERGHAAARRRDAGVHISTG